MQWLALQVARQVASSNSPSLQLAMQEKIALQVAWKVEPASIFRNAARQVAASNIPISNLFWNNPDIGISG